MKLPEKLFEATVAWIRALDGEPGDLMEVRETERRLCAHLQGLGVLPEVLPCGCCELVAVAIVVGQTEGQTVIDLQPVKRPARHLIH